MIRCYNDKDNVGIDEAARLRRRRTTMVDGAMDATMLVTWCHDKDKGDGCYNDKDNVKIEEAARLQRQRQVDVMLARWRRWMM